MSSNAPAFVPESATYPQDWLWQMYSPPWSAEPAVTTPSTSALLLNLDGYSDDDDSLPDLDPVVCHGKLSSSCGVPSYLGVDWEHSATRCEQNYVCKYMEDPSPKASSTDTASTSFSHEDCDSSSSIGSIHECDGSDDTQQVPSLVQVCTGRHTISDLMCWRNVAVVQGFRADPNECAIAAVVEQRCKVKSENNGKRIRTKRELKGKTEMTSSPEMKLSPHSWIAKQRGLRKNIESDDILRTTRSILNKLTLETFPRLYQRLISCGIKTADHLNILIDELFQKATTQHHFIDMYADLCVQLHAFYTKHPVSSDPQDDFKRVLLISCQRSFERHLASRGSMESDLRPENGHKVRMHMLGTIRFVGALATRNMLAGKVLISVLEELLVEPTSETLESLAALLTVVGSTFDTERWPYHNVFVAVMEKVIALSKSPAVETRVQCLLKDVIDLRLNGWLCRRPKQLEAPRKLDGTWQAAVISQVGIAKKTFDSDMFRDEINRAFAELRVSHDGSEAARRIGALVPPPSQQAEEVCALIVEAIQLSSAPARKAGFELITQLFLKHGWSPSSLLPGLQLFVNEAVSDLIHDLPKVSVLVTDEFVPAIVCLVSAGLLSSSEHESLFGCSRN